MTAVPAPPGGPAGRFVDLHSHSTASDGSNSPSMLVAAAKAAGLVAIALTDHDTMAGVPEATAMGQQLGVRVVPGVELSAIDNDREVHVLGLHVRRPAVLDDALRTFRDARTSRARQIVQTLNSLGVGVSFEDVIAHAGDAAIGRPHIARALIDGGWARDSRDAFDRYLGAGRPAYVAKHRLSVADAIALIHDGGGIAVLAHPGGDGRRDVLERYAALGMDGVEVRHPGHTAEDMNRLGALAAFLGLLPSGGSDWHGAGDGPRVLGAMRVPAAWLERQDERVEARRATDLAS